MIPPRKFLAWGLAAFLAALPTALHAQAFYQGGNLLTPLVSVPAGHSISGLDADDAGNLYYFDVDTARNDGDGDLGSRLFHRSAAGVTTQLFSLASAPFSANFTNFLRLQGSTLYFGESSYGNLYRGLLVNSGATLTNINNFGNIPFNYDLVFDPNGVAYLSADPVGGADNQVFRVNLNQPGLEVGNGAISVIGDTNDFSGPIAFDDAGNLFYGVPGFGTTSAGIYRVPAALLQSSTSEVFLAPQYQLTSDFGSSAFLYRNGQLLATRSGALYAHEFSNGSTSTLLGSVNTSTFDYTGALAEAAGLFYLSVTGNDGSAIYQVIPEPSAAWLALLGITSLLTRRRRA